MNAVTTFLARLSPPLGQFLEIRTIVPDGRARSTFAESVEKAVAAAERANGTANVYVGACPRFRRSGKREDVSTVIAAWADLDFHQIDGDRDKAAAIAEARIASLRIVPTIVAWTGNGLHTWWLFNEPQALTDEWPAERFEAINRGIAAALGGDAVHDLARVLRVPGTMNLPDARKRARGCVPVRARLLYPDGPRHDPAAFRDHELAWKRSSKTSRAKRERPSLPDQSDPDVITAFKGLLTKLGARHPLTRTWRGQRVLNDMSRSGWDMALVNHLYLAGVRESYIPHIVRAHPNGRGVFASDEYIHRTMDKARSQWRGYRGTGRIA